jgi:hypothetical protein
MGGSMRFAFYIGFLLGYATRATEQRRDDGIYTEYQEYSK